METISTNLYKFNELSDEAQALAIEKHRYFNVEYSHWSLLDEDEFKEKAKSYGFDVKRIYYSLSYSQGDGAIFEGTFYLNDYLEQKKELTANERRLKNVACNLDNYYVKFRHYGRYYHEKSYTLDSEVVVSYTRELPNIEAEVERIDYRAMYESLCKELYQTLQETYDDLTSDEAVKESLIANEYYFYASGEFYGSL